MSVRVGRNAKVVLGTYTVAKMSSWRLEGITTDLLETTGFGDDPKQYEFGLSDYGVVAVNGYYDPDDTVGQNMLRSANINQSKITDLKLYVDNTTYWTPDVTTLSAAGVLVQSWAIAMDHAGVGTIEFSGKMTGPMVEETA